MRARLLALFAVLAFPIVVVAPAGAGGGGGGPCTAVSRSNQLTMRDYCFDGVAQLAVAGSTITVVNEGQTAHNLVAVDGDFGVKQLNPGARDELEIEQPGVYQYYCTLHGSRSGAGMAGVLIVQDRAALAAARSTGSGTVPATPASASTSATTTKQPGSAWGWVALAALLLAGGALCVSLAVVRPRQR